MAIRILLADDEAPLRDLLREGLHDEGFEVVVAANGAEALELFRTQGPFDAVLVDEEMPRMTGRQLVSRLRRGGSKVPVVLISGHLELPEAERQRLGVAAVVHKPVSLEDLARALRDAIEAAS